MSCFNCFLWAKPHVTAILPGSAKISLRSVPPHLREYPWGSPPAGICDSYRDLRLWRLEFATVARICCEALDQGTTVGVKLVGGGPHGRVAGVCVPARRRALLKTRTHHLGSGGNKIILYNRIILCYNMLCYVMLYFVGNTRVHLSAGQVQC